jgi:hypothetical protein
MDCVYRYTINGGEPCLFGVDGELLVFLRDYFHDDGILNQVTVRNPVNQVVPHSTWVSTLLNQRLTITSDNVQFELVFF